MEGVREGDIVLCRIRTEGEERMDHLFVDLGVSE